MSLLPRRSFSPSFPELRELASHLVLLSVAALAVAACGGGGGGDSSGSVSVDTGSTSIFITDSPSDDFDEILVSIRSIELIGGGPNVTIFEGDRTIDLKQLEDFSDLFCHAEGVPARDYTKIRLHISRIQLVDGDDIHDVDPPANGKLDLIPHGRFRVRPGINLSIEIDMDAGKSILIVRTGHGDRFRFRPVVFVRILETLSPAKLTRVHGEIREIDDDGGFELCATMFLAAHRDRSDDDRHEGGLGKFDRCFDVDTDDETGVFDPNGDPSDVESLVVGDEATVVGAIHVVDDNHDAWAGEGSGASGNLRDHFRHHGRFIDAFRRHHDDDDDDDDDDDGDDDGDDDDDDGDDDDGDDGDDDDDDGDDGDDDNDRPELVLLAYVIEVGPAGTFLSLAGLIETDPSAGGEFDFAIDPGQGFGDSSVVTALLQDGTRIFSRGGQELDESDVVADTEAKIDGVLETMQAESTYKTALLVLEVEAEDEVVRGRIVDIDESTHRLLVQGDDDEPVCVDLTDDARIFLIREGDDGSSSEEAEFEDLYLGLRADFFGETPVGADCFESDAVIGFPEACEMSEECDAELFCARETGACEEAGECHLTPMACQPGIGPVCGCDGVTYNNECEANAARTSVDRDGMCGVEPVACMLNSECPEDQYCQKPVGSCEDTAEGFCGPFPQTCPTVIDPVCGCDGVTYDNACQAGSAGATVDHEGACEPADTCGGPIETPCPHGDSCLIEDPTCDPDAVGSCVTKPGACPDIFMPVCSCNDVTYANACLALRAGARVAFEGPCAQVPFCGGAEQVACDEGELCVNEVGACSDTAPGICVKQPEACPAIHAPVCGCNGTTYANVCEALAAGVNVERRGECEVVCGGPEALACPVGQLCITGLGCNPAAEGYCVPAPDECPDTEHPVCGCDGETYLNACTAKVAGVDVQSLGVCPILP